MQEQRDAEAQTDVLNLVAQEARNAGLSTLKSLLAGLERRRDATTVPELHRDFPQLKPASAGIQNGLCHSVCT